MISPLVLGFCSKFVILTNVICTCLVPVSIIRIYLKTRNCDGLVHVLISEQPDMIWNGSSEAQDLRAKYAYIWVWRSFCSSVILTMTWLKRLWDAMTAKLVKSVNSDSCHIIHRWKTVQASCCNHSTLYRLASFSTRGLTTWFQLSSHELHSQWSPSAAKLEFTFGDKSAGALADSTSDVRRASSALEDGKEVRSVTICLDSCTASLNISPFLPSFTNSSRLKEMISVVSLSKIR